MKLILMLLMTLTIWSQPTSVSSLTYVAQSPPAPKSPSTSLVGNAGNGQYYYWIVARYTGGRSAPSPAAIVVNAPNTLNGSNYIRLNWDTMINATGYDLLRTTTATIPNGDCNCAVVANTTSTTANDQGGALSSYTLTTQAGATNTCTLDNINYATPTLVCSPYGGAGSSYTPGPGILIAGSVISSDTSVMQSRSNAQSGASQSCISSTGNDTYTCTLDPDLTAYTTNGCVVLNANFTSVGTATLNIDGLGAVSILNKSGGALANGDITANQPITLCYNGAAFIIQGDGGGGGAATMTDVYWPFGNVSANGGNYNPGAGVQKVYSFTPSLNLSFTKLAFVNSGTGYTAYAITTFDGTSIITNATASCNNNTDGSGNGTTCSWAGTVSLTAGTTYRFVWSADAATGITVNSGAWVNYNNGSNRGYVFSSTRSIGDATATSTGTGATRAIAVALGTINASGSEVGNAYPIVAFIP